MGTLTPSSGVLTFTGAQLSSHKHMLKGLAGVYALFSPITGNYYIGSSIDLWLRLSDYGQPWFLARYGTTLPIGKALVKYGFANMQITIITYTSSEDVLKAEQAAIDLYRPKYNVLKTAGSTIGRKHTDATKALMRKAKLGGKASDSAKAAMSLAQTGLQKGRPVSTETRSLISKAMLGMVSPKAYKIEVLDLRTGVVSTYNGYAKTAKALGFSISVVRSYLGRSYRGYALRIAGGLTGS